MSRFGEMFACEGEKLVLNFRCKLWEQHQTINILAKCNHVGAAVAPVVVVVAVAHVVVVVVDDAAAANIWSEVILQKKNCKMLL